MKKALLVGIIIVLASAGAWYFVKKNGDEPQYKTEAVRTGDLVSTVTATGTVNAVKIA